MSASATLPLDKPSNGLAGLKHLRHDILSGIVVSLVSLPLSSGIAIASGVPPIYGLLSAIIAGLIFPFIGGAYLTISGPAAGLAPALMAVMVTLGGAGDAEHVGVGYQFLLVVIFMVGCVQIVMAAFKLARFASIIPVSVVEGMLASIGLLIIVKQLPMFFGYTGKVHAHEFFEFVSGTPEYAMGLTPAVAVVSMSSLVLLFVLGAMQKKVVFLRAIPPQLLAVIFGLILGQVMSLGQLNPSFLIALPKDPFHAAHLPHFSELLMRQDLWYAALLGVVTLTMIDGVESLATAMAIDRIDPFKRKSQPNRVLLAMGISNIASSLIGGLTIIPGGVKSKANIASGGRTLWANFTNAICLIIYLVFARDLINLIPKGVLAAVLIYTGWKMCEPLVWAHMAKIGREQLAVFSITILSTLMTDLLWGIVVGILATWLLDIFLVYRAIGASRHHASKCPTLWEGALAMFRNPITRTEARDGEFHLYVERPLVCFNSMKVSEALDRLPASTGKVVLHLGPNVMLVDHTACENLMYFVEQETNGTSIIELKGLENMRRLSKHHACVHVYSPVVPAVS